MKLYVVEGEGRPCIGVFLTLEEAIEHCSFNWEWVVEVELGKHYPDNSFEQVELFGCKKSMCMFQAKVCE